MLDGKRLDTRHREVRDPDPGVWEPACRRLGSEAARDQASYGLMCELLTSSLRELRVRGLVALREVAPAKPREVLMFLADRIAEARVSYDPLILEAVFSVYPGFPGQLGQKAVRGYLSDAAEGVRAAATGALRFWPEWPDGTLYRLATDSSLLVRASLIAVLPELPDSLDKREALEVLREAPEPELSMLLEEAPAASAPPSRPSVLNEEQACELLASTTPTPLDVQRFEQTLIEEPEAALGLVREGLEEPGGGLLLKHLGDLCRIRSLATLFRAWSRILSWQGGDQRAMMLQVMGILESAPESRLLAPLRGFVKGCLVAVECQTCFEVAVWAGGCEARGILSSLWWPQHPDRLTLAREALVGFDRLVEVGRGLDGFGLFQLSRLASGLVGLAPQIEAGCPRPERDLLLAVVSRWQTMVGRETERLLGGGDRE